MSKQSSVSSLHRRQPQPMGLETLMELKRFLQDKHFRRWQAFLVNSGLEEVECRQVWAAKKLEDFYFFKGKHKALMDLHPDAILKRVDKMIEAEKLRIEQEKNEHGSDN